MGRNLRASNGCAAMQARLTHGSRIRQPPSLLDICDNGMLYDDGFVICMLGDWLVVRTTTYKILLVVSYVHAVCQVKCDVRRAAIGQRSDRRAVRYPRAQFFVPPPWCAGSRKDGFGLQFC